MSNKIKFGLKNVHYVTNYKDVLDGESAEQMGVTEQWYGSIMELKDSDGNVSHSFGPQPLPGAVELTLEPRGDMIEFYADDMMYYTADNNQGYEGTLTIANVPDHFRRRVLGEELTEDGVLVESQNGGAFGKDLEKPESIALMFEFDGDKSATRYVLYNCTVSRPDITGETKDDSPEPGVVELSFVASPRPMDGLIKAEVSDPNIYDYANWYHVVYKGDVYRTLDGEIVYEMPLTGEEYSGIKPVSSKKTSKTKGDDR